MEFAWTEQQRALWDEMVAFGRDLNDDNLAQRDHDGTWLESGWQRCADKGIFGWYIPQEYGGSGYDLVTTMHGLEALGYGCRDNGFTLAVNAQMWAVQEPIQRNGTDAQKALFLPKMIDGSMIAVHGMTETESGSNAFGLKTHAEKTDGGYVINGSKTYITLGPMADLMLLFATVNPDAQRWGITAFLVDADSEGVELGAAQSKMGVRTVPMGDVHLRDVFVPQDRLLGRPGAGASIFDDAMQFERSFIFASHVGSMARQLDDAIAFSQSRVLGNRPIGKNQSISNRIANMKIRLETARMFLYKAAWRIDQGDDARLDAAMANLAISELFLENSLDAVRIHGGVGYMSEHGVERDLRDAVGGVIYSGTSDIQRNLIAGLLGL